MDARPQMADMVSAFGQPISIRRPAPNEAPVSTSGIWLGELTEEAPYGGSARKVAPRKVMSIPLTASLTSVPEGSLIAAANEYGGPILPWLVEGPAAEQKHDEARVIVRLTTDPR